MHLFRTTSLWTLSLRARLVEKFHERVSGFILVCCFGENYFLHDCQLFWRAWEERRNLEGSFSKWAATPKANHFTDTKWAQQSGLLALKLASLKEFTCQKISDAFSTAWMPHFVSFKGVKSAQIFPKKWSKKCQKMCIETEPRGKNSISFVFWCT